jgi:hypothetical protein
MIDPHAAVTSLASRDDMAPCLMLCLSHRVHVFPELQPGNKTPNEKKAQGKDNRQYVEGQQHGTFSMNP